jgi:hypothetical protein
MASAGKENTAPNASVETTELAAQLREARMENELLQAELNSVADTAKTLKKQLECVSLHARPSWPTVRSSGTAILALLSVKLPQAALHSCHVSGTWICWSLYAGLDGRDTEDELSKVADERDDAKKEREEVKWQARQAEKRTAAAEEELDCVRQVQSLWLTPAHWTIHQISQ